MFCLFPLSAFVFSLTHGCGLRDVFTRKLLEMYDCGERCDWGKDYAEKEADVLAILKSIVNEAGPEMLHQDGDK